MDNLTSTNVPKECGPFAAPTPRMKYVWQKPCGISVIDIEKTIEPFWSTEIKNDLDDCIAKIQTEIALKLE